MIKEFSTFIPTRLVFGVGAINKLASLPLLGKKAFIVIGSGHSTRRYGYLDKLTSILEMRGIEYIVYDKILPNPIKDHVMEGAEICREGGCDFVIGLGGGSPIDSAKSIAIMACNEGDYWDYINGGTAKGQAITSGVLPIIAIPTTAGTGTEIDPWTVVTHDEQKIGFGIDETFPVYAIVDPELMVSVPSKLTAYQGFDAFFHSSEGYIANCSDEISDLYALRSISLVYKSLAKVVADGADLDARSDIALASTLAGMVESTSSCISEHSLAHAISALYPEIVHGEALISISIAYFKTFINDCPERYIAMYEAMTGEKTDDPNDFLIALEQLQIACGVNNIALSEKGLKLEDIPRVVENARYTMAGLFKLDPRPITDEECIKALTDSYK